jgi:transcriptional regulator with XRE-family HTH domain
MRRTNRIRQWRKHRGLTQEQLAGRIGMHSANLSKLESGTIAYTQDNLEKLAVELACQPSDLITRDPLDPSEEELIATFHQLPPEKRHEFLELFRMMAKALNINKVA